MKYNPLYHHRHSIRLKGWDYTSPGAYFVTLCVKNRECIFGKIVNQKMILNEYGMMVREKWTWLGVQYPYVGLDEYIVMPNHFHGLIWIRIYFGRGGSRPAPTENAQRRTAPTENMKIKSVGRLIGAYKTVSTKQINISRSTPGEMVWQRDFYDHIGRDARELYRIRRYIRNNPANWDSDGENSFA